MQGTVIYDTIVSTQRRYTGEIQAVGFATYSPPSKSKVYDCHTLFCFAGYGNDFLGRFESVAVEKEIKIRTNDKFTVRNAVFGCVTMRIKHHYSVIRKRIHEHNGEASF